MPPIKGRTSRHAPIANTVVGHHSHTQWTTPMRSRMPILTPPTLGRLKPVNPTLKSQGYPHVLLSPTQGPCSQPQNSMSLSTPDYSPASFPAWTPLSIPSSSPVPAPFLSGNLNYPPPPILLSNPQLFPFLLFQQFLSWSRTGTPFLRCPHPSPFRT